MAFLLLFIRILCEVLFIAILLRIVLSWFSPRLTNMLAVILYRITEPILAPLRRIIPRVGMVAIILLQVIFYLTIVLS